MMVSQIDNRIDWIDTARGLGLMFVFVGHLHTPFITTWIYTFHMPLFFFLSGLVLTMHPFREFMKKKISRLVVPYFTLGVGIYLFYAALYAYENKTAEDYWIMFKNLIEQKAFWTIWFLAALFFAEILSWIVVKISMSLKVAMSISSVLMMLALVYYHQGGTTLYWCIDVAFVAQFFVMLGYVFKCNYTKVEKLLTPGRRWLIMILSLAINIIAGISCIRLSGSQLDMSVGLYGTEIYTIISAISGIIAIILLCQMISHRFLTYIGQNTMIFFAWHSRIIIVACGLVYGYLDIFQDDDIKTQIIYSIVTLFFIIAVLYPVTEGIKRLPIRKYFGV